MRKSGRINCPYVQKGTDYTVIVFLSDNKESEIQLSAAVTAGGGIRPVNTLSLDLNYDKTGVTLSAPPVFSDAVVYGCQKYTYSTTVEFNDSRSLGYGESPADELFWTFWPSLKEDYEKEDLPYRGPYPAYVTVFCNLLHESLIWSVGLAQSEGFIVSF